MGNCQTKCPSRLNNANLVNVGIGEGRLVANACTDAAAAGTRHDLCPDNDEWEPEYGGACLYDSLKRGCAIKCVAGSCDKGHCEIAGGKTRCVRRHFSAKPTDCCLQGGKITINGKTCHPDFRNPSGAGCRETMKNYCQQETNFFKPVCQTWLKNLGTDSLKDQLATKICPKYADSRDSNKRKFCACYNAKVPPALQSDPVLKSAAICLDQECRDSTRALQPAQHKGCNLNYVLCQNESIRAQLMDEGAIGKVEVENQCGITLGDSDTGTVSTTKKSSSPSSKSDDSNSKSESSTVAKKGPNTVLIISAVILMLILLLLLGGGAYYYFKVMKK